jgi:hypothetical protein
MIQASFTDLVGTSAAVPAHAFDIAELTELTPTLDIAMAAHDTAEQGAEAAATFPPNCYGASCYPGC